MSFPKIRLFALLPYAIPPDVVEGGDRDRTFDLAHEGR